MPAKGSKRKHQDRENFVKKSLYQEYLASGGHLSEDQFFEVVDQILRYVGDSIAEDSLGYKFPAGLGYIAVTKYKTGEHMIDHVTWCKTGKKVPLLNLHSLDFQYKIKWFKNKICHFRNNQVYKFEACKELKYKVRDQVYAGKHYDQLTRDVFVKDSVLQRYTEMRLRKFEHE